MLIGLVSFLGLAWRRIGHAGMTYSASEPGAVLTTEEDTLTQEGAEALGSA